MAAPITDFLDWCTCIIKEMIHHCNCAMFFNTQWLSLSINTNGKVPYYASAVTNYDLRMFYYALTTDCSIHSH
jgi:hypothetical protein